ncbi:MAG: hypothetical protein K6E29_02520 [Cyanobacteria bacterium RUI128]|nr:hypothetical protein [Cyanobacteria bacterium RUI128]
MSMLINTISAIGNNNSFAPLLVRDCGIEAPTKVYQRYNQNAKESQIMAKHATRECFIDEYGSSAIWLGGVPAVEAICNKIIDKKGLSSAVNYKLLDDAPNAMSTIDKLQQGVDVNIEKFKNIKGAEEAVEDLKKAKLNKNIFKNMTVAKYTAAIAIPVALMGFVLPKSNFALTNFLMAKDAQKGLIPDKYLQDKSFKGKNLDIVSKDDNSKVDYKALYNSSKDSKYSALNSIKAQNKSNSPSFKGYASFMTGLTQQQKMAMTDGGLGAGRIGTSRRKNEAIENSVRVGGMMYLNFYAPKQIDKGMDKAITKIFGINPSLDPKIMANKRFLALVRSDKLELPKTQEEVIDFIDNNPKSVFSKMAEKKGEVKFLKCGIRDPRRYVDTEKVFNLAEQMREFGESARKSGNVKKYARKALGAKSASILANIAISSSLLAIGLPQLQFAIRRTFFDSDVDPGLV